MAKQRFVVYKALDKHGVVLRYLLVVGGKCMPFAGDPSGATHLSRTSADLMTYGGSHLTIGGWISVARRKGASHIQKVIYFN